MIGFYNYTVYATYLSLVSAVVGVMMAASAHPAIATICLLFSGLCDMFDGRIARTRKRTDAEKQFGIQIDSLSDLVAFGVLPAAIGFCVGMTKWYYFPTLVLYVLCALIRLAYYNVTEEERQSQTDDVRHYFEGVPVTMSALIMPAVFLAKFVMDAAGFTVLYAVFLLIMAILFITPVRVPKGGTRLSMVFLGIGAVLMLGAVYMLVIK